MISHAGDFKKVFKPCSVIQGGEFYTPCIGKHKKTCKMETPKIYVGTYGKYNNGSIAGDWLDLTDYSDISEFYEACKELHSDEDDAEYMFQDHENIPPSLISESWLSENIFTYIDAMGKASNEEAFTAFINNYGYDLNTEDIDDLLDSFDESFQGEMSKSDFAYDTVQDMMPNDAPEFLTRYFDYDAFERDLFMDGYTEVDGFIFRDI